MKTYLCGPIAGKTDSECKDWRARATEVLVDVLDPMARDYRSGSDGKEAEIVEGDKRDIDACGALLVWFPHPSVGTAMEVLYAWERGKVVVVVDVSGKPISPWMVYHSTEIFKDLERALDYIRAAQ